MSSISSSKEQSRKAYTLGVRLFNQGKGTHAQIVNAMIAWRSAADAGMPEAMYALGVASASASQNDAAAAFRCSISLVRAAAADSLICSRLACRLGVPTPTPAPLPITITITSQSQSQTKTRSCAVETARRSIVHGDAEPEISNKSTNAIAIRCQRNPLSRITVGVVRIRRKS
jgi:hypothetical protein